MRQWWVRPAVRLGAALLLPVAVPLIITLLIWALPGDPASIICPPESCGGTELLAERWHLDEGPMGFFGHWLGNALQGDLGQSWRFIQGESVAVLIEEAVPTTLLLIALAFVPMGLATVLGAFGLSPRRADPVLQVLGLVPAILLAMAAAAVVEVHYGTADVGGAAGLARLGLGALVLGLADGVFSGALTGTRGLFRREEQQRYVGIAILRGERTFENTLPNVAPAVAGQVRARALHMLSGAVVVEVVLRINGLGDLLWAGALWQDFGVVLAAATGFAVLSSALLAVQALAEVLVAVHVRRAPAGVA